MNVKLGYALWEAANMPNNRSVKQMQPLPTPPSTGGSRAYPLRLAAGADHRRRACPDRGGTDLPVQGLSGAVLCGETLDCAGSCGGFNLHWAFGSGLAAGRDAAKHLCSRKR
ncbi:MAG: hypothetical protein ACLVJH_13255 [Faecalibacterium prausnitzii]